MYHINSSLVKRISREALVSSRLRKNCNFHPTLDDLLQRMLNALEPGTYVQPHKHENPDKVEVFIVLSGKLLVVEFEDDGTIREHTVLSHNEEAFGVEIPAKTWHSIIALEPGTVIFEVKNGPYSPVNDKDFAPWAPKEGAPGCAEYIEATIKKCGL
jgi:cupin fold WbuC family metalloprotein